ncbi:MAG TPA: DUF6531 domain-containing protein [Pseudonocardiaceae bacterium]
MTNPLVARAQDSTTWHTGINLLDDASGVAEGVSSGSWVEGGISALGVGLDALTIAMNPVGTLISYGLNWLIEHVKPLTDALDHLAGDADQIAAYAQTWGNISKAVGDAATQLSDTVNRDTANWTGQAADAYRANITNRIHSMNAAATAADAIGTAVRMVGVITAAVRMLVRDIVTQAIGDIVQDAAEEVFSLGLGTPVVVAQVVEQVSAWVEKISGVIRKLINSVEKLRPLMSKLEEVWEGIQKVMRTLHGHDSDEPHLAGDGEGTSVSSVDDPHAGGSDGSTATSSADGSGDSISGTNTDPSANSKPADGTPTTGDPIDVTTGVMLQSETDLELPGTLPLVISRTHKSSYRVGRWFGRSWASTLDQKIEIEADAIHFVVADGMLLKFPVPDQTGWVIPDEGTPLRLARTDGGYTVTDRQGGQTLHFAANGTDRLPITAITDRNDNRIDLDYDQHGTLTGLRHSGGYHVAIDTTDGLITQLRVRDPQGPDVVPRRYRYNQRRQLTEVLNSSGLPMRFDYDPDGRMTRWEDRNGMWYRFFYDADGRCVRGEGKDGYLSYTFAYDPENHITRSTNSLGHTTTYHLNERRQVIREVNPLGHATLSEWDPHHRLLSRTDPVGRTTRYEYDPTGNLLRVTRPDGSQAVAEYNGLGLPTAVVEPNGAIWRYDYDEHGNRIEVTDPAGAVTRYHYSAHGHLAGLVDPLGAVARIETNAAGLPIEVTDPTGGATQYTRDGLGRVVEQTDPVGGVTRFGWTVDGKPAWRTGPDDTTEQWAYDGEGNPVTYTDQLGQITRTEYGAFDTPTAATPPDGARLEYRYDTELRLLSATNPQSLVWRYEYDPAGNLINETDFNGRTLRYGYDPAGQLIQRINGIGQTAHYVHDVLGNIVEQTTPEERTRFIYDPLGRLVRATDGDTILELTRDPLGRILTETCNGRTVTSRYDLAGRRVRRVSPSGVESTWEFDPAGRATAVHTGDHTLAFTHDAAGRETERNLDEAFQLAQTWNPDHELISQTLIGGQRHALAGTAPARTLRRRDYTYRSDGYLTGITDTVSGARNFDLDPAGRVTAVHSLTGTETYGFFGLAATHNPVGRSPQPTQQPSSHTTPLPRPIPRPRNRPPLQLPPLLRPPDRPLHHRRPPRSRTEPRQPPRLRPESPRLARPSRPDVLSRHRWRRGGHG